MEDKPVFTVRRGEREDAVAFVPGQSILDACREAGVFINAPCGGGGRCGKCGVTRLSPEGREEVSACRTEALAGSVVLLPPTGEGAASKQWEAAAAGEAPIPPGRRFPDKDETNAPRSPAFPAAEGSRTWSLEGGLAPHPAPRPPSEGKGPPAKKQAREGLLLALDLGTTTLAGALLDAGGNILAQGSAANPQQAYGADVISRIQYALERGSQRLTREARRALNLLGAGLCREAGAEPGEVERICLAGNSVMQHLFWSLPVEGFAAAPYQAFDLRLRRCPARDGGLTDFSRAELITPPLIGSYVGGDTVCACLAADMDTRRDTALMMDIGTNGEIALSAGGSLWACSTAAGPAFEGAGILHGMRAEAGAIWGVTFSGGDFRVEVIGGGPPRGVCGTGLMEAAGALKRAGLMEAGGRLLSPEELSPGPLRDRLLLFHGQRAALLAGDVVLTQGDIRQLQLAKAALRCGAELICKAAGVAPGQVETLLLAGAFGSRLTGSAAEGIGLLPPGLGRRLEPMGNAALDGAKKMLLEDGALPRAEEMAKGARHVELAKMPGFEDTYVDALEF